MFLNRLLLLLSFLSFVYLHVSCFLPAWHFTFLPPSFSCPAAPTPSLSSFISLSSSSLHLFPSLPLFLHDCLCILNRSSLITFLPEKRWIQLLGSLALPLPVTMTTASALSFIEEGVKEKRKKRRWWGKIVVCHHMETVQRKTSKKGPWSFLYISFSVHDQSF